MTFHQNNIPRIKLNYKVVKIIMNSINEITWLLTRGACFNFTLLPFCLFIKPSLKCRNFLCDTSVTLCLKPSRHTTCLKRYDMCVLQYQKCQNCKRTDLSDFPAQILILCWYLFSDYSCTCRLLIKSRSYFIYYIIYVI